MNDSPTDRPVYIPNGEFIRSRFVLAATAVALVAALLAAALAGLNHIDGYAVGWIWLPVVGSLYAAIEGSSCCVLSVQVQSASGRWQFEIQVENGIAGATYHDREEALRVRWQHLVDGRQVRE